MDDLLKGGLPKGRTIMVSGSCGTGKSTFAGHFINQGLSNREKCVYVTFEEGKDKLLDDLEQLGLKMKTKERNGHLKIIGGSIGDIKYYKDKTKASAMDLSDEITEVVDEMDATRVVLDSINLFLMLFDTDEERRHAMANLSAALEKLNCTTILTCEVKEGTKNISWYGFEEFVVDGVIRIYRVPYENLFERAISVIKMRGMEHSPNIAAMQIRKDGLHVYPNKSPFHKIMQ